MYACMFYLPVYVCVCVHACVVVCTCLCMMSVCAYKYVCVYIYIYICVCVHIHVCVRVCALEGSLAELGTRDVLLAERLISILRSFSSRAQLYKLVS